MIIDCYFQLAEGLRLVEDVKHQEYLRYQYERLTHEKDQIEKMITEEQSKENGKGEDTKKDSNKDTKLHHPVRIFLI